MKSSLSHLGAIGLAMAGFTCWVLADTSIKLAGQSNLPSYELVAFLGLFIAGFLFVHGLACGEVKTLWPRDLPRQFVRSCLDVGNNLCVVIALRHLSLTLFYILVFAAPMVVAVASAVFGREGLTWRKGLAVMTGFAGVVIAVDPFGSATQGNWAGYLACMVCVACFSTNMLWSRTLTQTERPESLTFFSGVVMAAAGFALMLWHSEPLTWRLTATLGAMGLFCSLGSMFFFVALKHTSAANVAQYHYTQLISGTLVAWLLWHQEPSAFVVLGGVLIIGSGLYIAVLASREPTRHYTIAPSVPE